MFSKRRTEKLLCSHFLVILSPGISAPHCDLEPTGLEATADTLRRVKEDIKQPVCLMRIRVTEPSNALPALLQDIYYQL